jgi:hypothetical protein
MSVSMFRGQVDRLQREIAQLEARVADERSKAARERSEALRIAGSISRTTSPSMAASKLKQAQQREERAVGHDKRAATHAAAAAGKGRQLTTAQASLDRRWGSSVRRTMLNSGGGATKSCAISIGWRQPGARRLRRLTWPIERSHPRRRGNDGHRLSTSMTSACHSPARIAPTSR